MDVSLHPQPIVIVHGRAIVPDKKPGLTGQNSPIASLVRYVRMTEPGLMVTMEVELYAPLGEISIVMLGHSKADTRRVPRHFSNAVIRFTGHIAQMGLTSQLIVIERPLIVDESLKFHCPAIALGDCYSHTRCMVPY